MINSATQLGRTKPERPRLQRKKILLVGGSLNQTTMVHQIGVHLSNRYDTFYTPSYADGLLHRAAQAGWVDFTVLGGQARRRSEAYLRENRLPMDYCGEQHEYDLIVSSTDLVVPANFRGKRFVLIQEGMTDPENYRYHLVRTLRLPRYFANTSMNGLSHAYDLFCVASEGYRDVFVRKGVNPAKIRVTGIPNFDHAESFLDNDFPHRRYVLAVTSCLRETFKAENRKAFIRNVMRIADGRPVIFKLHPNERHDRAVREVERHAPNTMIFTDGNTNHMVANCDVFVTKYSSVIFIASALGKEIHSDLNPDVLKRLTPLQNGGTSGQRIADLCASMLE